MKFYLNSVCQLTSTFHWHSHGKEVQNRLFILIQCIINNTSLRTPFLSNKTLGRFEIFFGKNSSLQIYLISSRLWLFSSFQCSKHVSVVIFDIEALHSSHFWTTCIREQNHRNFLFIVFSAINLEFYNVKIQKQHIERY